MKQYVCTELMYRENVKSLNAFVGCNHQCVYCIPSFQRQAKRQECPLHRSYTPHAHLERLRRPPPKTAGDEFIFFPSSGDLAFAEPQVVEAHIEYAERYSDRTFLVQSKAPQFFADYDWPSNVILGTTLETDRTVFNTPSEYKRYEQISKAPLPYIRYLAMKKLRHQGKILITIEPILQFSLERFNNWLWDISPNIIYVGYDDHQCKLPEPPLKDTFTLIDSLKVHFDVRAKTLRNPWWEKGEQRGEDDRPKDPPRGRFGGPAIEK